MYRVIFYCPDTNLKYDGRTPDRIGLGGGKTAFIRMAKALRDLDNEVIVYGNSDPGNYDGVEYRNFTSLKHAECDILVVMTTSKLDLTDWDPETVVSRLSILWVQGIAPIRGLDHTHFDYVYAVSGYLHNVVRHEWGIPSSKIVTTSNAFSEENAQAAQQNSPARDKYGIVFASHPSKGLSRVIEIVNALREYDSRFYLDIYGGNRLWDAESQDDDLPDSDHIRFRGLVGQWELYHRLRSYNFMIAMSGVPDACSLTLIEAKKAGVLVLASAVGSNAEIIQHEYDGFILEDDYLSPECKDQCVKLILRLVNDDTYAEKIRSKAMSCSLSWHAIAKEWLAHWDAVLQTDNRPWAMKRRPKVSVVMSVYNGEPYLKEAVDSILGQTLWDFEFIIVNDGSTDGAGELLRSYDDPRIVVIDQSNQGTWAALNKGIQYARGEYIARMDADDISHPRRLQNQVEFLDNNRDVGLVGTSGYKIDAYGRVQELYRVPTTDTDIKCELPHGHPYLGASMMCRRATLDRIGSFRNCNAEDFDLWLRISERFPMMNLEEPLYKFRRTGNTRTALHEAEIIQSVITCRHEALKRYLQGQDSEGYPRLRHTPVLGMPILDLRRKELGPYSKTLHAWGDAFLWKDNRTAQALYARAVLSNPFIPRRWAALLKSWIIQHDRGYRLARKVKETLADKGLVTKSVE